ncbi:protein inturned-like [Octopus sinensis]|uniref:Protein inturned n=1 Tax=Octopus sinensis TaxID=2607531 RepID=A0A7E6END4_9MOLL|nr:protein inturned-like [Octopus sinensis]
MSDGYYQSAAPRTARKKDYFCPVWSYHIGVQGEIFFVEAAEKHGHYSENIQPASNSSINVSKSKLPHSQDNNSDSQSQNLSSYSESINTSKFETEKSKNESEVFLLPVPCEKNSSELTDVEYFEKLFGIVLCSYNVKSALVENTDGDEKYRDKKKLIVQKVIIGSQAQRSHKIHKGDMLLAIDDREVSWSKLGATLKSLKKQVPIKLTFQNPVVVGSTNNNSVGGMRLPFCENVMLAASGEDFSSLVELLDMYKCKLLCLSLDIVQSDLDFGQEIIYEFPFHNDKVSHVRGMFITLNKVLEEIVQSQTQCSNLVYHHQLINVSYYKDDNSTLLLVLPTDLFPEYVTSFVLKNLVHVLALLFGNPIRPFKDPQLHVQLNQILALLFYGLAPILHGKSTITMTSITNGCFEARWLFLEEEIKLMFDEILSSFESGDFVSQQDLISSRRQFCITGSCLIFKGHVICSHLETSDLLDAWLLCQSLGLVSFSQEHNFSELIVWHEVFLSRLQNANEMLLPAGYNRKPEKCFIFIVGQKQSLICCIFESKNSQEKAAPLLPDLPLVNQAKTALQQMENVNLFKSCDSRLRSTKDSLLGDPDVFLVYLESSKVAKMENTGHFVLQSSHTSLGGSEDHVRNDGKYPEMSTPLGSQMSVNSNDSLASGTNDKGRFISFNGIFDMSFLNQSLGSGSKAQVTQGIDIRKVKEVNNVLFHYMCIDKLQGIYVDSDRQYNRSTLSKQILDNFNRCSLQIHAIFEKSKKKANAKRKNPSRSVGKLMKNYIREHGVLFNCIVQSSSNSKMHAVLSYWVVGRLFTEPVEKEIYVCYHDSVEPNLVELAYQMSFSVVA